MPGDTANIIYLGLIGVAAASYVLVAYRGRMVAMVQQALIWVLIFLAALIVYGFKGTLQQQLFPRQGVAVSDTIVSLPRARDGHFYADLLVNGTRIKFVVDTGASDIVLSRKDAGHIGLSPDSLNYFGVAETANGPVKTAFVTLKSLELGRIVDRDVTASVNAGDLTTSLLGMAYLRRFGQIEIIGDTLLLHR